MTWKRFEKLVRFYRGALAFTQPIEAPYNSAPQEHEALQHVSWMLDRMLEMDDPGSKAQRWLGFVHGVLWAFGVYTLNQLRDQTRKSP